MKKKYKLLLAAVLLMFSTTTTVLAVVWKQFYSAEVTYATLSGVVELSLDQSTWTTDPLTNLDEGDAWYARFVTTADGYSGSVTILWTLVKDDADTGYTVSTSVTLTGDIDQIIYASADGLLANNHNWGLNVDAIGEYTAIYKVRADFTK